MSFEIDTLELEAFQDALERKAGTVVLEARAVSNRYAGMIVKEAQRLVPVDTGRLKRSIHISPLTTAGGIGVAQAGVVADAPYAGFVEFGTSRMSPQPYLGPAFKKYRKPYIEALAKVAKDIGVRGGVGAIRGQRERFSIEQQLVAGQYVPGGAPRFPDRMRPPL